MARAPFIEMSYVKCGYVQKLGMGMVRGNKNNNCLKGMREKGITL